MSILVRHKQTGRVIYYVKGAEVVMDAKVKEKHRVSVLDYCESLAMEGLRTLVIAQKVIPEADLEVFMKKYQEAANRINNREQMIQQVLNEFEKDLDFLGVTGVEDKLQTNVQITIESLKNAGIQVWMLTGDKVETATSIAISAGLKSRRHNLHYMRELEDYDLKDALKNFMPVHQKSVLIIDGKSLDSFLNNQECLDQLFGLAIEAPCVCVCRCSPT